MATRFRKSKNLGNGVKLNVGKKSVGVSVGGKYGGVSFNTRSGAHARASAPGTGVSYTTKLGSSSRHGSSNSKSNKGAPLASSMNERQINTARKTNPIFLVLIAICLFIGIPTFSHGGFLFIIIALLCFCCYRHNKNQIKSYESLMAQDEAVGDTSHKSDTTKFASLSECFGFSVAGVTFETDGQSRQEILRKIRNHYKPYDSDITFSFKRYEYKGDLAIGVYVNGIQIGNVPQPLVSQFNSSWVNSATVSSYEITGGNTRNGMKLYYGIEIMVEFS